MQDLVVANVCLRCQIFAFGGTFVLFVPETIAIWHDSVPLERYFLSLVVHEFSENVFDFRETEAFQDGFKHALIEDLVSREKDRHYSSDESDKEWLIDLDVLNDIDMSSFDAAALEKIEWLCGSFLSEAGHLLIEHSSDENMPSLARIMTQAGGDFYLDLQRTGAGFLDGSYPEELADYLHDLAQRVSHEIDPYIYGDKVGL